MNTKQRISSYLTARGIQFNSVDEFIESVSNTYHEIEAAVYDGAHMDIQLSGYYWEMMLNSLLMHLPDNLAVLDVGCGTGYASLQVIKTLGNRIANLTCLDLSPDMLSKCHTNLQDTIPNIEFICGSINSIADSEKRYDLVITNSILHHLLDPPAFLTTIAKLVRANGWYIAGNEPNSGYYVNQHLLKWWNRYRAWKRLSKLSNPHTYLRKFGLEPRPLSLDAMTNRTMLERGLIKHPFPAAVIPKLVDIHVPPAKPTTLFWGERGFDSETLVQDYLPNFTLINTLTYSHIKDAQVQRNPIWRFLERRLQRQFPNDGADMIFAAHYRTDY